ncbi:Tautomerase/MIF superfamily [Trichoderma velutinum]
MDQPVLSPSPILSIVKPVPDAAVKAPSSTFERRSKPKGKMSSLETVPESDSRIASQHTSSLIDAAKSKSSTPNDKERLSTKRNQYFYDALHERSGASSAAASVRVEALVHAELKTNVKARKPQVENEQHFLTAFSYQLAARYNRYPSSTVISLHHGQCLLFSGSSDPAYTLTITALAAEIQPATNKCNAAVLQKHLEAVLRVPTTRGMLRFIPVAEECLAWGSKTVAGRISEALAGDGHGEGEKSKVQERRRLKVALSLKKSSPTNITSSTMQPQTLSQQAENYTVDSTARVERTAVFEAEESAKVVRKKKSIIHTLFRTSRVEDEDPSGS